MPASRNAHHKPAMQDPPLLTALTADVRFAKLWLLVRLYVGGAWLVDGWHRMHDPSWSGDGLALRLAWERALQSESEPFQHSPFRLDRTGIQFMLDHGWYRWMADVIAIGETVIGILLLLGLFTGFAALVGTLLTASLAVAGGVVTSPLLLILSIPLIAAWKVAGWLGLDRWVLPLLGAPWQHSLVFRDRELRVRSSP